jgi:hypothetical protein
LITARKEPPTRRLNAVKILDKILPIDLFLINRSLKIDPSIAQRKIFNQSRGQKYPITSPSDSFDETSSSN